MSPFFFFFCQRQQKAKETRVSELEAHASTLAAANGRLSRSREALIDDAFNAEDLLCAATDRMRRSRGVRSTTAASVATAATAPAPGNGSGADGHELHQHPAAATAVAATVEGLPPRSLYLDPRGVGDGVTGRSAEFATTAAGRCAEAGGGARNVRRGRPHRALASSPRLSASVPLWPGGGGDGGGVAGASSLRSSLEAVPGRGRVWEEGTGAVGVDGGGDGDIASVAASSAAMDVLRELERMHVS